MRLTRWIAESITIQWFYTWATTGLDTPAWLASLSRLIPRLYPPLCRAALWISVPIWLASWAVWDTGPIGVLTWAVLALALLNAKASDCWPKLTGLDGLVAVFFATAVISAAASSVQPQSLDGLVKFATFLAGYGAFRLMPPPVLRGVVPITVVGLATIEALIGFYQYINHIQPLATWEDPTVNPELKLIRVFGTLKPSNPNLLAGFLIPPVALAGMMSVHALVKARWRVLLFCLSAFAALLVALVLTGSRGGFLAIGAMSLTSFLLLGHLIVHDENWPRRRLSIRLWVGSAVVAILGFLALLAGSPAFQHRVASIFSMREDSSNAFRLNVYHSAWQMFLDNWLIGIGPGNATFKLVYGLYMVPGYTALSAYSVPLEIAVEQGVIGFIAFIAVIMTAKIKTLLLIDDPQTSLEHKLFILAVWVGMVGSLTYGLFDTIWYRPSVNLGFWWLLASLSSFAYSKPAGLLKNRL